MNLCSRGVHVLCLYQANSGHRFECVLVLKTLDAPPPAVYRYPNYVQHPKYYSEVGVRVG
jgi:hypothetical protein